jgi:signal transduction histidine kinase
LRSSLSFLQIEAGKMTLESTDFDIVGLMENLVDIMSVQSVKKGVELALDLPGMLLHLTRVMKVRTDLLLCQSAGRKRQLRDR